MFQFSKPRWQILKDKKVYETPIFSLHQKTVLPDKEGSPALFYVLHPPNWINVIPLTPENDIILVEQYRHGIDETTLELPGGMVDEGENAMEAAKRELIEETGYSSQSWHKLGKTSSNPAIIANFTHLYLAEGCIRTAEQQSEGHEDIKIHRMPLQQFLDLTREGVVHHAIVLAAVTKLLLKRPDLV